MSQAAIVTGASSGIGRAAARRLATSGMQVLAVGRDERALQEICREIEHAGGTARWMGADVTTSGAPSGIVARALDDFGRLDAVVNAAGIISSGAVYDTSDENWDAMLDINVRAPFRLIREATPALVEQRGAVVNVSSVAGPRAFPGVAAYCVSKAAIDQLTRCAALDLAPKGVRVNAVNPGVVRTNLHRRSGMEEGKYLEFLERSRTTHPLGRIGTVEEIADVIAFLLSPSAGWITGETIAIDGGRHLTCLR
jgi:NAD(P)-dependent dehydrogenase (short-subunit alcohol dehydrogenase family)